MSAIGKFFHKIFVEFPKWIQDILTSDATEKFIDKVHSLVPIVLSTVAEIAAATSSESDDEFIAKVTAIYQHYDMQLVNFENVPKDQRWSYLLQAAVKAAQPKLPGVSLTMVVSAVQMAYGVWQANQKPVPPVPDPIPAIKVDITGNPV